VVPTYREVASLPHLLDRLRDLRDGLGGRLEVLVMDDDSRDGSLELVAARAEAWVQFVVRTTDRGLSSAVLDGLRRATGDVLVCMDADLSHPPPTVPHMLDKLAAGADFVIGSRYVEGGSTSDDWGFLRWLNSRVATLLARPLTAVRDPMAGFFAMQRSTFAAGKDFNPVGYKVGLELLVKCRCERVVEVPIHFEDRRYGESKLTLTQQLLYLKHLRRLYVFKYGVWTQMLQFMVVGGLGTLVNVVALTLFLAAGLSEQAAVAAAIAVALCFNFALNRRFSFVGANRRPWPAQFLRYAAGASVGAMANLAITLLLLRFTTTLSPQACALFGIAAGMGFNFLASRYFVFRAVHVKTDGD
jgi:dolichol-phosphate mannosyltransferase